VVVKITNWFNELFLQWALMSIHIYIQPTVQSKHFTCLFLGILRGLLHVSLLQVWALFLSGQGTAAYCNSHLHQQVGIHEQEI